MTLRSKHCPAYFYSSASCQVREPHHTHVSLTCCTLLCVTGRGYRHRRLAVREAWASNAQNPPLSVAKFILSEDEKTTQVQKELDVHGDIVFVRDKTNYKSILYKTFYVLEYAVQQYDCDFVLKTDDDAFVNVPPMVAMLRV